MGPFHPHVALTSYNKTFRKRRRRARQSVPLPLLFGSAHEFEGPLFVMEKIFVFLNDIYLVCRPNHVAVVYEIVRQGAEAYQGGFEQVRFYPI